MTPAETLVEEVRELEIKLYGKRMELAYALGQRDDAEHWQRVMYAAITERIVAKEMEAQAGA